MYKRILEPFLAEISNKYNIVTLIGPRQSGKSTLSRTVFPDFHYVSLENLDLRQIALQDPRRFLNLGENMIIDEVQRAPDLLSYLQGIVDEPSNKRRFILTGSQQLMLMEKVSQSLAGRTFILKLLPFSKQEIIQKNPDMSLEDLLFTGGYPKIYDKDLPAQQWLSQYFQTYVERDVRELLNIGDLDSFQTFLSLCAGRAGSLLNLSSLATDCGISQPTAKAWLSVLKTSFICYTLKPHFRNFSKRLIKSPKLYFYDTGLLCLLLRIRSPEDLLQHPMRGAIFENWVIMEKIKNEFNQGQEPHFYFWRDVSGHEIDLVIDEGTSLFPVEIKSSQTFNNDFTKQLSFLNQLQKKSTGSPLGECIYAGTESFEFKDYKINSWKML